MKQYYQWEGLKRCSGNKKQAAGGYKDKAWRKRVII